MYAANRGDPSIAISPVNASPINAAAWPTIQEGIENNEPGNEKQPVARCMLLGHRNMSFVSGLSPFDKGKPLEKVGRKTTGLNLDCETGRQGCLTDTAPFGGSILVARTKNGGLRDAIIFFNFCKGQ